jgi:type I restriction-modification system DNA methylase subunit
MKKKQELKKLVELFEYNIKQYKGRHYDEAKVRADFIDKFFLHLGWDMYNNKGYSEQYREVIREDRVEIKGRVKAPDYCFRLGGVERKFFVEAKKPAVDIKHDVAPAFQLRRYAYTAKLPLSILTDFEEFAVYDTRIKPHKNDKASTARIFYCTYREYEKEYDFIYNTFSEEGIRKGSFDKYIEDTKRKKGTSEVDKEFLKLIESWRENLAKNIALRNKDLSIYELNYAVQKIIDRIIFLRIAEDREIETYARLQKLTADKTAIYPRLVEIFTQADYKYNSGIFNFKEDRITPGLEIDDKVLKEIINSVYYPDSPYEFSVFDVEILGNIYEQFLGKTIRLTPAHQAKVEDKPEVKKAGGVYYTPKYIVEYIVKNTVEEKIKDKQPDEIAALRILDPACGSGSFLLGAYQLLLDYHLHYYTGDGNGSGKKQQGILKKALKENRVYRLRDQEYRLTIEEKQRVLLNNIFGVDIDSQAVEVTKLSLLLKLMEGESRESTGLLFKFSDIKLLPDLSANIKCGNSLIGSDFYDTGQLSLFRDEETVRRINVFDWEKEFPLIFARGGFDIVIGNPPYIRINNLVDFYPDEVRYIQSNFVTTSFGKVDIYVAFIEKGYSLLNKEGVLGFIIPNKFMQSDYGVGLRDLISKKKLLKRIIDFGFLQVFENATIYTCILILSCRNKDHFLGLFNPKNYDPEKLVSSQSFEKLAYSLITKSPWSLSFSSESKILKKIENSGVPFPEFIKFLITGVKTGANKTFVFEDFQNIKGLYQIKTGGANFFEIESELFFPYWKAESMKRYHQFKSMRLLLYPYELVDGKTQLISKAKMKDLYPLAWSYLNHHKQLLENRQKGKLKGPFWYGLSFASDLNMFEVNKIVTPTLAPVNSFSIDSNCNFFPQGAGGGCGIVIRQEYSSKYILGVLNSKLLTFYFQHISSCFKGGWYAYEPRFLRRIPIYKINFSIRTEKQQHDRMVEMVEQMLELQKKFHGAKLENEKNMFKKQIDFLDNQIDKLVYKLYGLTEEEIKIVEGEG